ncbi:MAG: Ig-like domain-containing protein, partial [Treponema sp.]|nr:Ig-like domain-containing protein [Treponema sp.]
MKLGKFSRVAVALLASAVFYSCSSTTVESSGAKIDKSMIGNGGEEGMTDFYVASVSPNEEVPSTVSFPSIQIQFSKPVVALAKLGEPITSSDVVTITPKLNGVFRWYGTSLLSFDTSDALIPQKEYYITVNPDLTSADGTQISGPVCYTFHTEEMTLSSIEPGYTVRKEKKISVNSNDIPPEYARDMAVNFKNKVNPQVVAGYITVADSDGNEYGFKA